jgi:hypothetical protein
MCVFAGVALMLSFKNLPFAFTMWLAMPEAQLWTCLCYTPFLLILTTCGTHVTWILRGHCRVIHWLNFSVLSQWIGRSGGRERRVNCQKTHNTYQVCCLMWVHIVVPQTIMITNHRSL